MTTKTPANGEEIDVMSTPLRTLGKSPVATIADLISWRHPVVIFVLVFLVVYCTIVCVASR